jgi:hypothetical protein
MSKRSPSLVTIWFFLIYVSGLLLLGIYHASTYPNWEQSTTDVKIDPYVYNLLSKSRSGSTAFLVTFRSDSSLLSQANNPSFLFRYFQEMILPQMKQIKVGQKNFEGWLYELAKGDEKEIEPRCGWNLKTATLKGFEKSFLAHVVRGIWVYETMKSASAKTHQLLTKRLEAFSSFKSIKKYVVSNSWLMEGGMDVIDFLIHVSHENRVLYDWGFF